MLNIHYSQEYQIFEEIRCNRAILNNMIVISEKSLNNEEHPLKNRMIECDYDKLIPTILKTLKTLKITIL